MSQAVSLSAHGLELLCSFEGFRAEPLQLADGRFLVGYGSVRAQARSVDEPQALALLGEDVSRIEAGLARVVLAPVTQAQVDALISFAFSIGWAAFEQSEALRRLNAGDTLGAAAEVQAWRLGGPSGGAPTVLAALVRRRTLEAAMLLDERPRTPVASALVRPQRVEETAPPSSEGMVDEITERLRHILAQQPASARCLHPPPPPPEEESGELPSLPEEPLTVSRALEAVSGDAVALLATALLAFLAAAAGAALLAGGGWAGLLGAGVLSLSVLGGVFALYNLLLKLL